MLLLKVFVILVCALIAFQDFKERAVSWILFPIMGCLLAFLYLKATTFTQFSVFVLTNFLLVTGILLILYLYTKHFTRKGFLNVSFGLGDLLFFYAFALGFPTPTFIVLFATAILFSLVVFLFSKKEKGTVPLAGLMGFFLMGVFLTSFFPKTPSLYIF